MDKANNKLVNNFAKTVVDTYNGYIFGNAVVINHKSDEVIQDKIQEILESNNFSTLLSEVGKESCIKGKSYILSYLDEFGEFKMAKLSPEQLVINKDIAGRIIEAIRYYTTQDFYTDINTLNVVRYTADRIEYYQKADNVKNLTLIKEEVNKFGRVPVTEFLNNSEETGEIENIESLINAYNLLQSLQLDEFESFRNAYFVLKNADLSEEGKKLIKESSIIQLMDNGEASFLTKKVDTQAIENTLTRIEKDIYKFSCIPNMGDEHFAGNLSGIAIKYKIMGMENKAINKERLFAKGLKELLLVMQQYVFLTTNKRLEVKDINITFNRNLPENSVEEIEEALKAKSLQLLSDETILSRISFVQDPQSELLSYEKQEEDKFKKFNIED